MGALVAYLEHVGTGSPTFLQPPVRHQAGGRMAIDAATRERLELVRTMTGARDGSLLGPIDRTVTAACARLLAHDLASPARKTVRAGQSVVVRVHSGESPILENKTK